ncbi:MAG: hypothetical protein WDZ82_03970 [Candidatus Paceibacterota bacterium]
MADREGDNKLEKAQNRLYSRDYNEPDSNRRSGFEEDDEPVRRNWDDLHAQEQETVEAQEPDPQDRSEEQVDEQPSEQTLSETTEEQTEEQIEKQTEDQPQGYSEEPQERSPEARSVQDSSADREAVSVSAGVDEKPRGSRTDSFFNTLFWLSLAFFVLAISGAVALFLTGSFFTSGDNVLVRVEGPTSVSGAEDSEFDIIVANNNDTGLTNAKLTVTYPEGARYTDDLGRKKAREVVVLDTVDPGQQIRATIDTTIIGRADTTETITLSLEYGLENSSATFVKETEYDVAITNAPIDVSISSPTEINSNQPVTFDLTISSNTSKQLENLLLVTQYPFGFSLRSADPEASDGDTVWEIGTLEPGEEKNIRISGPLQAQEKEQRTFTFSIGIADENRRETLAHVLDETKRTLSINAPYLDLDATFQNMTPEEFVGEVGDNIRADISWKNNLDERIADVELIATLGGNAFSRESVQVDREGFYRSSNNEVVWNMSTNPALSSMDSNEQVNVNFLFASQKEISSGSADVANPHITVELEAIGNQFTDAELPETVSTAHSFLLKMNTVMDIEAHAVYSDGPFVNTGPVPPVADKPTTFTVVVNALNRYNDVEDAEFTARLPTYVEWTGNTTNDEVISYNSNTREIRWNIGELRRQSGHALSAEQVAFQVEVTPSISHIDEQPEIVTDGLLLGRDTYTEQDLRVQPRDVTTNLEIDPQYSARRDGTVRAR